jgi:hypothetical protein
MTARQLLEAAPHQVARAFRIWLVRRSIRSTERNLEYVAREIADRIELKRYLQLELMQLKAEQRSI